MTEVQDNKLLDLELGHYHFQATPWIKVLLREIQNLQIYSAYAKVKIRSGKIRCAAQSDIGDCNLIFHLWQRGLGKMSFRVKKGKVTQGV